LTDFDKIWYNKAKCHVHNDQLVSGNVVSEPSYVAEYYMVTTAYVFRRNENGAIR